MQSLRLFCLSVCLMAGPILEAQHAGQQVLKGTVRSGGEPVEFATVTLPALHITGYTNGNGYFEMKNIPAGTHELVVTCVGFTTLRRQVMVPAEKPLRLELKSTSASLNAVVVTGTQKETSRLSSPIPVEVYHPAFFRKNPAPGIFESLNMVNGVQPQLNCNVCNTGDIHINGMEGPYTMVLIDGMPIVSSLATVYGLSGIPTSMVKRIEVVKGPASTLYGSEAVGGVINIITKEPASSPAFSFDVSGTTLSEWNADVGMKMPVGKARSLFGVNGFFFDKVHDVNHDGFTDLTLQKRISLFNKWTVPHDSIRSSSFAFRYMAEQRWGGEVEWTPEFRGTDSVYGESITTHRTEMLGQISLSSSVHLDYSYNYHFQDSYYGIVKYLAEQHTAFSQLRWEGRKGRHDLLGGIPVRYIYYDDNTPGTGGKGKVNNPAITVLPGIFVQDEISLHSRFSTLVGLRYDHHNIHGNIFAPRLAFKYLAGKDHTLRLSGGNGFRVVNLFTEDHAALTGARTVVIQEALRPEESWNVNTNYTGFFSFAGGFAGIDASLFYTRFTNKIVADFMTDPTLIIYDNLRGYAVSKGITVNTDLNLRSGLRINAGATVMDVYQVERDSLGTDLRTQQQFAPAVSGTFAVSYTIPKANVLIDLTGRVNGPMHLPVVPNDFRPARSPWYTVLNIQLSKKFNNGIEVYTGIKNLLNFIPLYPILRPEDPFDKHVDVNNPNGYRFDPSYNYAPVQGIKGYAGVRWSLY
jgi:outer membrane receptor for ferrienterochelin and colicins